MADQGKDFLGRGWAFPFAIEPDRGRIAMAEYEEDIRQAIRIILSTAKGERVMRPDFGCGIHDLVFGAVNTELIGLVKRNVEEALRTFEARIELLKVTVDQRRITDGILEVVIDFRVHITNQLGNFVYPFYFKEAA